MSKQPPSAPPAPQSCATYPTEKATESSFRVNNSRALFITLRLRARTTPTRSRSCETSSESYRNRLAIIFPNDDNLGMFMPIVCSVYVGGRVGVGACPAEVGDPAGSAGGRLGGRGRRSDPQVLYPCLWPPVRIYLHKIFGWPGFGFLSAQTFRVAGV